MTNTFAMIVEMTTWCFSVYMLCSGVMAVVASKAQYGSLSKRMPSPERTYQVGQRGCLYRLGGTDYRSPAHPRSDLSCVSERWLLDDLIAEVMR